MKLHLPKQLFTALLAAITLATPATLSLGSAAWGAVSASTTDGTTTVSNSEGWSRTYSSVHQNTSGNNDISSTTYNSKEVGATIVTGGRLQINGGAADTTSDNLVSTYGGDLITGGSGHFFLQTWGKGQIDLSNDFYLGGSTEGTYGDIRFGNDGGHATNLTGNLYLRANSKLYSGGENAVVISGTVTDDVTEGDTTHSGSYTLTLKGKGYQFTGGIDLTGMTLDSGSEVLLGGKTSATTVRVDTVTNNGTLTLSNTNATLGTVSNNGTLRINGTTLNLDQSGAVTGNGTLIIDDGAIAEIKVAKAIQSRVQVNGGGTLKSSVVDGTWYETNGSTKSITLAGTSDAKMATFEVTARQTFITPTYMNGYAQISGSGSLQLFNGATFTVSGTNNIISTALTTSRASVFDIAEGGTLEISGQITRNSSNASSDSITKKGAGELIFSNANNSIQGGLIIEAGEVTIADGGKINIYGSISNAGTLSVDGTLNVSVPTNFDIIIAGYSSSSSDYTATKDNGYGYGTEIIIADGAVTIGANGTVTGVDSYRIDEAKGLIGETNTNMLRSSHFYVNTGTVKLGTDGYTDFTASTFVVKTDAILNINGKELSGKAVELGSGATLANGIDSTDAGAEVGQGKAQLKKITLTGDATVHAQSDFGLLASSWGETRLNLNDQTLSKEGTGTFFLVQTTVEGGGKIMTNAGALQIGCIHSANEITTANNVVFSTTEGGTLSLVNGGKLIAQGVEGTAGTITGAAGTTLQLESTASHEYQGSVTGGFNLIKKGTGTQTFSGATSLGAVTVEAGTLAFGGGVSGAPLTHSIGTLNAANGTLSLAENTKLNLNGGTLGTLNLTGSTENAVSLNAGATLTVTSALSGLTAGSVTLGEGSVLDLSGINVNDVFGMATQSVSGAGTVKYAGAAFNNATEAAYRVSWRGTDALNFATDVEVASGIALNTYGNGTNKNILSSKNLTVGGELRLESGARLSVSDGAVSAGTIGLGHTQQGNPGHIELTGGSITTGGITKANSNDTDNTLTMSGGVLEITSETGIASGIQTTISGGTLKATNASWAMSVSSLGNAAFDISAGQSITVNGSYDLTGSLMLTGNTVTENETTTTGTLVLGGTMNVTDTGLLERGDGTYSGAASNVNGFFTGNYYLVKNTDNAAITTTGLSVTLGGEAVASENISLSETGNHLLLTGVSNGIFYVNSGEEVAKDSTVNTEGYVRHHVGSEGVLVITPEENTLSTTNAQNALLDTTGSGTISLNGNLTIAAGSVSKATGKLAITSGAKLTMDAGTGTKTSVYDLSSFTSVELHGGTIKYHGAATTLNNVTVDTAAATLSIEDMKGDNGACETFTLAGTTTLNNALNIKSTNWKYQISIEKLIGEGDLSFGSSSAYNEKASVIIESLDSTYSGTLTSVKNNGPAELTLNNLRGTYTNTKINLGEGAAAFLSVNQSEAATLGGAISGAGSITKQGAGKLTLSGASSYTGTTTVSAGELALAAGASLGSGTVTVASGATLSMGDTTGATETAHTISTLNAASGSVTLADKATLNLSSGTSSIGTLTSGNDSKINLAANATLNRLSSTTGTVTLTGSGVYDLGSSTSSNVSGLTEAAWTGTVKLTGGSFGDMSSSFNALGNSKSTVEVSGVSGWFNTGTKAEGGENLNPCTVNLKLVNTTDGAAAISINNLNSDSIVGTQRYANFTGVISGTGDIKFLSNSSNANTNNQVNYRFSNDVKGWTGAFINAGAYNRTVRVLFTGLATTINASVINSGNVAGCESVLTMDADADMLMNGEVNVNNLAVEQTSTFTNEITVSGAVDIAAGKSLKLATKKTVAEEETIVTNAVISGKDSGTASMGNVKMNASGISSADTTGATTGMISNTLVQLQEDASFTIEDMTLTNTSITAASVNIEDSKVSGNVVLNVVKPTEAITAPNVGQGGTGGKISFSYGLALVDNSSSLTLNMEVPQAILPSESGLYTLTITLNGFAEDFNFSNIDSQVVFGADSWLGQALVSQKAEYTVVTEQTPATAGEGGVPTVSYAAGTGANVGSLVITITGLNVPEPTTSTLSLLALAALAARRRRK